MCLQLLGISNISPFASHRCVSRHSQTNHNQRRSSCDESSVMLSLCPGVGLCSLFQRKNGVVWCPSPPKPKPQPGLAFCSPAPRYNPPYTNFNGTLQRYVVCGVRGDPEKTRDSRPLLSHPCHCHSGSVHCPIFGALRAQTGVGTRVVTEVHIRVAPGSVLGPQRCQAVWSIHSSTYAARFPQRCGARATRTLGHRACLCLCLCLCVCARACQCPGLSACLSVTHPLGVCFF